MSSVLKQNKSPRPTSYQHHPALTQQRHCDGPLEQAVIAARHPRNNFGNPGLQQTLILSQPTQPMQQPKQGQQTITSLPSSNTNKKEGQDLVDPDAVQDEPI